MNNTFESFIISTLDESKTITNIGWIGCELKEQVMDEIFRKAPTGKYSKFEKSETDGDVIQYYESRERAEEVIKKLHFREHNPIIEDLKIVKLVIKFGSFDEKIYYKFDDEFISTENKIHVMEEFESDARSISNENVNYSRHRNEEFTGYTDPGIQVAFEFWKKSKTMLDFLR